MHFLAAPRLRRGRAAPGYASLPWPRLVGATKPFASLAERGLHSTDALNSTKKEHLHFCYGYTRKRCSNHPSWKKGDRYPHPCGIAVAGVATNLLEPSNYGGQPPVCVQAVDLLHVSRRPAPHRPLACRRHVSFLLVAFPCFAGWRPRHPPRNNRPRSVRHPIARARQHRYHLGSSHYFVRTYSGRNLVCR
jgi:hypothetical protein